VGLEDKHFLQGVVMPVSLLWRTHTQRHWMDIHWMDIHTGWTHTHWMDTHWMYIHTHTHTHPGWTHTG
jgi:hypothetical protein